jgi:hypothetical protein
MKKQKSEYVTDGIKPTYPSSLKFVKKLKVSTEMKQRKHLFSCGTKGHVVDELIIKIKFPKGADIQPHMDFDTMIARGAVEACSDEYDGLLENQD